MSTFILIQRGKLKMIVHFVSKPDQFMVLTGVMLNETNMWGNSLRLVKMLMDQLRMIGMGMLLQFIAQRLMKSISANY